MKTIHLVCNAHLDPVWLWEWDEGAAEVLSTFRIAVSFCEKFEGFIFNHNEAILYKWVEEYDPELFERIRKQVIKGNWHIMGGWYLQPDCNMPSGESLVRQILLGRNYFKEKFNVKPTTAINFDPFGHTRGLVQILKKSGYDSYVVCRPEERHCPLPSDDFSWIGYDDSEIAVHRAEGYNSQRGQACGKVEKWLEKNSGKETGLILWGIGNHGGGPSKVDLMDLNDLMEKYKEKHIIHSIPEAYFIDMKAKRSVIPRYSRDLNPWAVGCYTSQIRIKQKHRLLENELFMTEKMISNACLHGLMSYPGEKLLDVSYDLAMGEFHDILPGSSIQSVEESSLRIMDHGLEIISKLKTKSFFALAKEQEKAKEGEIPIFIYNPHPFKIDGIFECEFNLPDINWEKHFSIPHVFQGETEIPSQVEKECSNLNVDWRKRVIFEAVLEPSQINRFNCRIEIIPERSDSQITQSDESIIVKTADLHVVINCKTGLIDKFESKGVDYLEKNSFQAMVLNDDDDSWGSYVHEFSEVDGTFELMSREKAAQFSGIERNAPESVRVIEDGDVRTVIEALYSYGDSFICQTFKIPKRGTEMQVQIRVFWNEKKKLLKLSVPSVFKDSRYLGQVAYGAEELPGDGTEVVAQKWTAIISDKENAALTFANDGVYGSSFCNGELRITLLRSPAYASMNINGGMEIKVDRFIPRIDQGERLFNFWFNAGKASNRLDRIDRDALVKNEKPYGLSLFTNGHGTPPNSLIILDDNAVQMTVFKKAERSEDYIIRLFEPTGKSRSTTLSIPFYQICQKIHIGKFEIKTFKLDIKNGKLIETNLMEEILT